MKGRQNNEKTGFSLSSCLNIGVAIIFSIAAVFLVYNVRTHMRQQALTEAEEKSMLLLNRNLAIHTYFSHDLKPKVFSLTDSYRPEEYFEPSWMSSTYAVREIDKYAKSLGNAFYYYKECAINARSPENEADQLEQSFVRDLNSDPMLTSRSSIRMLDGQYFFETMRRGESMEDSCLRCHDTPDRAPQGLVDVYGPARSFGRSSGEVVSAVSVRVPLAAAYAHADSLARNLSLTLLLALVCLFLGQFLVFRFFVGGPLKMIHDKALQVSESDEHLGEEVSLPFVRELHVLAKTFNRMSTRLRANIDSLEQRVNERTAELKEANSKLVLEIGERRRAEDELRLQRDRLQEALKEIKTLRGIVPICSYCKQIRNDQGAWQRLEEYIHDHSEAEFSHGLCPECYQKQMKEIDSMT